jgi:uncharacterized protein YydD (DUF2326 family)
MFLSKLYSEPKGLFNRAVCKSGIIEFHDGINYILGKKEPDAPVESLNGIGKSLLLDLIDFCLLASFKRQDNPRLFEAKEYLSDYKIVLEFQINGIDYVIKRNVDKPDKIEFGKSNKIIQYESRTEVSEILCDLIFKNPRYPGYYESKLLRKLLPFFLKIHKHKQQKFIDPIEYLKNCTPTELNQYHLFLMGIDNSPSRKNYEIQTKLKDKEPAMREIKRFIEANYGLRKISDLESEIHNLNNEIKKLELAIKAYKLADKYKSAEIEANKLTSEIKENIYKNYTDQNKIKIFQESIQLQDNLKTIRKIENIYLELNELLANSIRKTLQDAISFRQKLTESREKFLEKEINELEGDIRERENTINIKEDARAKLFSFLETKEAIKDLTEAFYMINEKKKTVNDLEGRVKLYDDLSKEKAQLNVNEKQLEQEVLNYLTQIKLEVSNFRDIFFEVYDSIYPENKSKSGFSIHDNLDTKSKIVIDVRFPAMRSEGKNQGRTLVYDIAILLNAIEKNIKCPRFLIHDGIFDGMDKAHFVAVTNLLHSLHKAGKKFQYILPINEEGTLDKRFGKIDDVTLEKMESEAIVILSPNNKLLNKSWN